MQFCLKTMIAIIQIISGNANGLLSQMHYFKTENIKRYKDFIQKKKDKIVTKKKFDFWPLGDLINDTRKI